MFSIYFEKYIFTYSIHTYIYIYILAYYIYLFVLMFDLFFQFVLKSGESNSLQSPYCKRSQGEHFLNKFTTIIPVNVSVIISMFFTICSVIFHYINWLQFLFQILLKSISLSSNFIRYKRCNMQITFSTGLCNRRQIISVFDNYGNIHAYQYFST